MCVYVCVCVCVYKYICRHFNKNCTSASDTERCGVSKRNREKVACNKVLVTELLKVGRDAGQASCRGGGGGTGCGAGAAREGGEELKASGLGLSNFAFKCAGVFVSVCVCVCRCVNIFWFVSCFVFGDTCSMLSIRV